MIICLLIPLSAVSASDINTTLDDQVLSATPQVDTLSANVNNGENSNDTLSVNENGLLSVAENNNLLGDSNTGSSDDFSELVRLSSGTLSLYQNFYFDSTVTISKSIVIEGNGYSISGGNTTFFNINAKDVVLSNLNFKNINTSNYLIYWNGDNGNMNTVSFDNITANFINWNGNDGEITNLNFTNIGIVGNDILYSTGDNLNMKNIYIENNTITVINVVGSNCRLDNLVNRNSAKGLWCSLSGNNLTFINSDLVNARFANINSLNFINSTNVNLTSGMFDIAEGGFLNVIGSNFTNITSLAKGVRVSAYFDNIKVNGSSMYDFTTLVDNYALIGIKDYFTISDSVFTNIHPNKQNYYMFCGGVQLYNCNITNSSGSFVNQKYAAGDYGILLNNTTVRDNKFNNFAYNTFAYVAYDNCRIINNTFNQYTVRNDNFLMNNTVVANNTINGDYVLELNTNRVFIANSNFTNNSGFKNDVMIIKGTNEYHGNSLTLNKMNTGVVNNNATFTTEENNWKALMKLYANATGEKDGLNNQSRCSLEYAINNIFYGGTIFLQPDVYDNNGKKYKIVSNLIGEKENGVIFNKGGYQFYNYQGKFENITFENLTSSSKPKPSDYFGIMFFSPEIVVNNCTFNKFSGSSIFYMDYYSSRGLQLINITIIESTLSGPILGRAYDASNAKIGISNVYDGIRMYNSKETGTEFILALHNNITIKNCDFINSHFDSSIIGMDQGYIASEGYIASVDTINITDKSSFKNIILNQKGKCIGNNIFVEDSTGEDTNYLFVGYGLHLDTVTVVNVSKINGIFNLKDNLSSIDNINVNDSIFNYFLATYDKDLKNIHLNNVSLKSLILTDNVNSYNNLNFNNVTFDNTDNVTFVLNRGNVLSDCVFDNVTGGHILVSGDYVSIKNTEFKNTDNHEFNGSCIYIDANFADLNNLTFTNNSAYCGAIYITNTTLRPSLTNSTFKNNTAIEAGGAIYIQPTTDDFYVTLDDSTTQTINNTVESIQNKGRINGMGGKIDFSALLTDVYVTNDTNAVVNDGKSWSTPTTFNKAYFMAGKNCVFHFVENNTFNYTSYQGSYIVRSTDGGWNFIGNNTTIIGLKFVVMSNHSLSASNITFKDTDDSAVIINGDHVEFEDCAFINCTGLDAKYGALVINASDVNITNCNFTNNMVTNPNAGFGAGIYINGSEVKIEDCKFENNTANVGAHIYLENEHELIKIINNEFIRGTSTGTNVRLTGDNIVVYKNIFQYNDGNYALGLEGLIRMLNVSSNEFEHNTAGGLSTFYINNIVQPNYLGGNNFTNNSASNGGAWNIKSQDNYLNAQGNKFDNNTAINGGAIYIDVSGVTLSGFTFNGNNATLDGGAIYNNNNLSLNSNAFNGNGAVNGGAIYNNGVLVDTGSVYVYNNATRAGGAIYSKSDLDYTAVSSTSRDFVGNRAVNGGALYINGTNNNIRGAYFTGNIADYGSCIYVENNTDLNIYDTSIVNNHVTNGSQATGGHGDIYLGNVVNFAIPDDGLYLEPKTTGSSTYNQYIYNSTNMVRSDVLYVSKSGTGLGLMSSEPTTLNKALEAINDNGRIIFVESYMLNSIIINRNVTLAGYNNTISMKRNNTTDKNKYLFNQPKNAKNKKKLCKNISFQLIIYPPI